VAINALFYENSIPTGTGVLEIVTENEKGGKKSEGLFFHCRVNNVRLGSPDTLDNSSPLCEK